MNTVVKEGDRLMRDEISYIVAKLENIHEDVNKLKDRVDNLRQAEAGRKAVTKFIVGSLGILGALVGWLAKQIHF